MKKIIIYRKGKYWIAKCLETSEEVKKKTKKKTIEKSKELIKGRKKIIEIPDCTKFEKGIEKYKNREKRDSMYKIASYLIREFWYNPVEITDGLGILLLTWNQGFYRYGLFDFNELEKFLKNKQEQIESFRKREICSFKEGDKNKIEELFETLLKSLQIASGKNKKRKSPVAVAKALHLLAPNFFPLWDSTIAKEYGCYYRGKNSKKAAEKYVEFCKIQHILAKLLKKCIIRKDKTLLKLIDEYNYVRYTKKWIRDC